MSCGKCKALIATDPTRVIVAKLSANPAITKYGRYLLPPLTLRISGRTGIIQGDKLVKMPPMNPMTIMENKGVIPFT